MLQKNSPVNFLYCGFKMTPFPHAMATITCKRLLPAKSSDPFGCNLKPFLLFSTHPGSVKGRTLSRFGSYIITRIACSWLVIIFASFPRAVRDETWIILRNTWHEFVRPLLKFYRSKLRQKSHWRKEGYHIQRSSWDIDVGLRSTD